MPKAPHFGLRIPIREFALRGMLFAIAVILLRRQSRRTPNEIYELFASWCGLCKSTARYYRVNRHAKDFTYLVNQKEFITDFPLNGQRCAHEPSPATHPLITKNIAVYDLKELEWNAAEKGTGVFKACSQHQALFLELLLRSLNMRCCALQGGGPSP